MDPSFSQSEVKVKDLKTKTKTPAKVGVRRL